MDNLHGIVRAVCVSVERGTRKESVPSAVAAVGWGLEGDAHGGDWHRQVSLLSYEKRQSFNKAGAAVEDGDFGENLLIDGIDCAALPVGTLVTCGAAVLEVTQIGKECHNHCQIYHRMGDCIMPREGVFSRVKTSGVIAVGDAVVAVLPEKTPIRAAVGTVSDKGSRGERTDESGPVVAAALAAAGYDVVERLLLADERTVIEDELINLADRRTVDLVLTTGGTGFSRRDVTPEATLAVADRNAPGIAEAIRAFSAQITDRAMLSRGAAAIRGGTLIVNLPGSVKAAREIAEYIIPKLRHGVEILRGDANECGNKK